MIDCNGIVPQGFNMREAIDVRLLARRTVLLGLHTSQDALKQIESTFRVVLVVPFRLVGREPSEVIVPIRIAFGITKLDVEIAVGIISIAHEAVSQFRRPSTDDERPSVTDFVEHDGVPFHLGEEVSEIELHPFVVAEIIDERQWLPNGLRTARTCSVAHVDRNAAVAHELSHSIGLAFGVAIVIIVEHVVPIVSVTAKIRRERIAASRRVGVSV